MEVAGKTPEERVKSYHKLYYSWIDKAIVADEKNDIEAAVQAYIKGLEYANMCLKEKVVGNNHTQVKTREVQEKMKKNREAGIERLEFLLSNKLMANKTNSGLKKSNSLEMDMDNFKTPKSFTKSMREKKSKSKGTTDKQRKDSCNEDNNGLGKRSHSATCINKITSLPEGNLSKALKGLPATNPANTRPTNKLANPHLPTASSNYRNISSAGPPKPMISDRSASVSETGRQIDKQSILSKLKNVDKDAIETIINEVLDSKIVKFTDVVGNDTAKQVLQETVIYPRLRPELFTGLRSPAKGVLLFGPPGNGKTLLAKAVANEAECVFFNISAASLMSKWVGEGEKLVRALFAVARVVSPSVIFLDEVDSLLSARNSDDKSVTRRMLTQFLQEIDGAGTDGSEKVLVMAATNRPDELDDAALRRFQKKIYIRMPDATSRKFLLKLLLNNHASKLKESDVDKIVELTKGYSSSDLTNLAKCAAMEPIRELSLDEIRSITVDKMRPLCYNDFSQALKQIKASVPPQSLVKFDKWNAQFGDNS